MDGWLAAEEVDGTAVSAAEVAVSVVVAVDVEAVGEADVADVEVGEG